MAEHYFYMETTGLCPQRDKIITVQWQRVNGFTGEPVGELQILKEWEASEKEILKEFLPNLMCEKPFDFIMVGKNLFFDFLFLSNKIEKYGLGKLDLYHWYSSSAHLLHVTKRQNQFSVCLKVLGAKIPLLRTN